MPKAADADGGLVVDVQPEPGADGAGLAPEQAEGKASAALAKKRQDKQVREESEYRPLGRWPLAVGR
jgi:hypothetical protein